MKKIFTLLLCVFTLTCNAQIEPMGFDKKVADKDYRPRLIIYNSTLYACAGDGLYKYSLNNGGAWLKCGFEGLQIENVVCNGDKMMACAINESADGKGLLLLSEDGGATYKDITPDNLKDMPEKKIMCIAQNPRNADEVVIGTANGGRLKTSDFGKSWQQITEEGCGNNAIMVYHPTQEGVIFASDMTDALETEITKTTDGGATWTRCHDVGPNIVNDIMFRPDNDNEMFYAAFGKTGLSPDGGKTWNDNNEWTKHNFYNITSTHDNGMIYNIEDLYAAAMEKGQDGNDVISLLGYYKDGQWIQFHSEELTSTGNRILDMAVYNNMIVIYTSEHGIVRYNVDIITEPFYEAFADGQGLFEANDVQKDEGLDYVWKHDAKYGYMKASAYNGANNAAESWLLSPWISFSDAEVVRFLNFDHCINKYFGNVEDEATVWIRKQGGEWKQLPIAYPQIEEGKAWSSFKPVCVDLAGYEGHTLQVGFRYTSTAQAAGAWEIRNFGIDTNSANGIETVNGERQARRQGIYNLAGQRLKEPAQGINIIDGRKVVKR